VSDVNNARTMLSDKDFVRLSKFIEGELGIKMPPAKKIMLESRLHKRLKALGLTSYAEYCDFVFSPEGMKGEILSMIDIVTTNKTDFFRESSHFDFLLHGILEKLYHSTHEVMNLWSSACSSGEEPYTLSMVLESFREKHADFQYQILATDISQTMLRIGQEAIYPEDRVQPVPFEFKKKYLLRSKDRNAQLVRIVPGLRSRVNFRRLNLMQDEFGIKTRFDVIFCRNVLIYFDRKNQEALLWRLYRHLKPGGFLFLGHSETLTGMDLPLTTVMATVYQKREGVTQ